MITHVVSEVVMRNRARNGALEPVVGAYAGYLRHRGYASITIENYLQCAAHFGRWLTAQHIDLHHVDEPVLHRFLTVHLPVCHCCKPSPRTPANLRRALRHLLRMLRSEGIVPPKSMLISEVVSEELQCFDKYLKDVRGLAPATRLYRLRYVREYLLAQFGWGRLRLNVLNQMTYVASSLIAPQAVSPERPELLATVCVAICVSGVCKGNLLKH